MGVGQSKKYKLPAKVERALGGDPGPSSGSGKVMEELCSVDDLKDGEMREFTVEDSKVLLVREKGSFYAIGGKCSHYGAPLSKGVLSEGHVRCPWHGACFNYKTGDIEDFPGLDSLPCFTTKVDKGKVKIVASKSVLSEAKRTKAMCNHAANSPTTVVIIGGGAAAVSCAETLRQEDYTGYIKIICKEPYLPYDRIKLSKALEVEVSSIYLRSQQFYQDHDIDVLTNVYANNVNTADKSVSLSDGSKLQYTSLVIATGGDPRHLTCPGANLKNVYYLRTPADGANIAKNCKDKNVVVIGSSFIGLEAASYLVKKTKSTTIVSTSAVPIEHVFGKLIGQTLLKLHESNNVKFRLKIGLRELQDDGEGNVSGVVLNDDSVLAADVVVVGIGVVPATQFLRSSTIKMSDRGFIETDDFMCTNVKDVYACGDIITFPLHTFGGHVVNIQHWQMAFKHGQSAAKTIAGKPERVYSVPFFWSTMFGKSIRYAGYGHGYERVIIHGSLEALKFVAYFIKEGKVVAVATVGRDPVAAEVAELFFKRTPVSVQDVQNNPEDNWSKLLTAT